MENVVYSDKAYKTIIVPLKQEKAVKVAKEKTPKIVKQATSVKPSGYSQLVNSIGVEATMDQVIQSRAEKEGISPDSYRAQNPKKVLLLKKSLESLLVK